LSFFGLRETKSVRVIVCGGAKQCVLAHSWRLRHEGPKYQTMPFLRLAQKESFVARHGASVAMDLGGRQVFQDLH
ncbi:MAG TPA: hypothetical protein VHB99_05525, partial [Pirellulales bacterium]|nr:hypothetical protein [Pirellulales bacterium]